MAELRRSRREHRSRRGSSRVHLGQYLGQRMRRRAGGRVPVGKGRRGEHLHAGRPPWRPSTTCSTSSTCLKRVLRSLSAAEDIGFDAPPLLPFLATASSSSRDSNLKEEIERSDGSAAGEIWAEIAEIWAEIAMRAEIAERGRDRRDMGRDRREMGRDRTASGRCEG
jgi:hypothetical protein